MFNLIIIRFLKVVIDELSTRIDQARSSNGILVAVQQAQQKIKQQPKGKTEVSRNKISIFV
jgi:hypothetical protein